MNAPPVDDAAPENNQVAQVYYDLRCAPLTFDAAIYFAIAIGTLRAEGYSCFNVHILAQGYRKLTPREKTYSMETRRWRLVNIILRLPLLIPGVANVYFTRHPPILLGDPRFPKDFDPSRETHFPYSAEELFNAGRSGINLRVYEASGYARSWARARLGQGKAIVLTLRAADIHTERDAPRDMWFALYQHLCRLGYRVFVIPDQHDVLFQRTFETFGWNSIPEAAIDMDLRLALYQECHAVIGWSGGNAALLWLSNCRFLLFGLLNGNAWVSNAEYFTTRGITVGEQPPFLLPHQQIDWTDAVNLTAERLIARSQVFLNDT
jgi:hypothetical protein